MKVTRPTFLLAISNGKYKGLPSLYLISNEKYTRPHPSLTPIPMESTKAYLLYFTFQ
jgi:hypothetical protein